MQLLLLLLAQLFKVLVVVRDLLLFSFQIRLVTPCRILGTVRSAPCRLGCLCHQLKILQLLLLLLSGSQLSRCLVPSMSQMLGWLLDVNLAGEGGTLLLHRGLHVDHVVMVGSSSPFRNQGRILCLRH